MEGSLCLLPLLSGQAGPGQALVQIQREAVPGEAGAGALHDVLGGHRCGYVRALKGLVVMLEDLWSWSRVSLNWFITDSVGTQLWIDRTCRINLNYSGKLNLQKKNATC